jgi:GTPase
MHARAAAEVNELAEALRAGSVRALARGLTWIEAGGPRAEALAEQLYPHGGRAHVVGITGSPGSGKSTLVRALVRAVRARDAIVGVIAVDPTSPFTGGAILGDRIRMNDLTLDPGVFIRSMATRGALGGLSRATADAVDLMDAAGRNPIFVETVGVGQDEVDIMHLAQTVVVVSVPGLGDDVQAIKAGILEIADIHVVNKADREGADRTIGELRAMLTLLPQKDDARLPPVLPCVAAREEGIEPLREAIAAHRALLEATGALATRRRHTAQTRVLQIAHGLLAEAMAGADGAAAEPVLDRVARREMSPYAAARALLSHVKGEGLAR